MINIKKYLLKKMIFSLGLFISQKTHAMNIPMEIEKADSIPQRKAYVTELITRTIALPTDIKRHIFQILPLYDREFHDEFITRVRTTVKKDLPNNYYYKNFQEHKFEFGKGYLGTRHVRTGLCPYDAHVAVLDRNHLQIINTQNHSIIHIEKSFKPDCQKIYFKHIALAGDTHTIATIHEVFCTNTLTIKNILTNKTESRVLPYSFKIPEANYPGLVFGFNKEGTHIIVRGVDKNLQKSSSDKDESYEKDCNYIPHHLILPVTVNEELEEHNNLSKYQLFSLALKIMKGTLPNNAKQKS